MDAQAKEMISEFLDEVDARGWFQAVSKSDGEGYTSIDMRKENRTIRWFFENKFREGKTDKYRWNVASVDGLVNVYVWKI